MIESIESLAIMVAIPFFTVGTSVMLFWLKFHSDARKRLDDLLIELEHEIFLSEDRVKVFYGRYLEIRKAATEFDRWIIDPFKQKRLRESLQLFRGQKNTTASIFELRGGPHESLIDTFLSSSEIRCISPDQSEFTEYLDRIASLRKITGSRRWADPIDQVI